MMQADEKPIHMNESGSKAVKTSEFEEVPSVALRTNHSASRERVTIMTCALSSEVLAMAARKPPIAACIKAESAARAKAVELPAYTNFSLDWTHSGSYDRDHFLSYLVCWLEKWDPARAAANDYRILFLDVAACHMGKEIEDYCWECGYVLVYHYGGTTSVMQVPDTHLHQPFSSLYLEVEQAKFTKRQEFDPGNVNRTLQEVLDDVITVWRAMDHMKGVNGHWEIGVANKLDGTQDDRITGEALEVWKRQRVDILRIAAIKDVNARVESGELNSFADVHKVIVPAPSAGEYRYGEEFEGTFPGKGEHWVTTVDEMERKADQADLAVLSSQITATPIDDALVEKEAARLYRKIEELKKCRAQVVALGMPSCKFAIDRRITDIERNKRVLEARVGGDVQAVLNAKLRVDRMLHSNLRDERRKTNSVAKKKKQRAKAAKAAVAKRLWKYKQERKARDLELLKCGSTYTIKELGEGPKYRNRNTGFVT